MSATKLSKGTGSLVLSIIVAGITLFTYTGGFTVFGSVDLTLGTYIFYINIILGIIGTVLGAFSAHLYSKVKGWLTIIFSSTSYIAFIIFILYEFVLFIQDPIL